MENQIYENIILMYLRLSKYFNGPFLLRFKVVFFL